MKLQTQIIAILFLLVTMSCSKGTRVFYFEQSGITPASAMRIETIKPVAAKPGEVVTITGQALTRQSQVKIGDTIVEFTESNGTMAKFIMPAPFRLMRSISVRPSPSTASLFRSSRFDTINSTFSEIFVCCQI